MDRSASRRLALPGLVLLTLALIYLIAWSTGSGGSSAAVSSTAPRTAPVTAVTRDCPPPGSGAGQAHVAMLSAPPRGAGTGKTGSAGKTSSAGKTPSARKATGTGKDRGSTALTAIPSASGSGGGASVSTAGPAVPDAVGVFSPPQAPRHAATEVTASGQLAQGFAAEQATANGTGTVTCTHPGSDAWFVGTGTTAGASATWLYLMNSGAIAASADVTVLTDAGVQSGKDNEVTVAPHRYLSVNIASLAHGSTVLAVHVQTSSGQVAADAWQDGGSGGAWLPASSSPATHLVLPGVRAASGVAKLLVAVPGARDAQLRVTALTARGKLQPLGTMPQDAPAAAASAFPLSSLGASATTLVVNSSVPVTAGALVPGNGIGGFTAASAPLTGQGVVAGNPSGSGETAGLVLSAPDAGARAAITVLPQLAGPGGPPVSPSPRKTLTVKSGHTVQVAVSPPKGPKGPFAIVVTPLSGSGPLYAARMVVSGGDGLSGTLQSLLPVPSAPAVVQLPSASDNYSAVLP